MDVGGGRGLRRGETADLIGELAVMLGAGQDLDTASAEWAMDQILEGSATSAQIAGFVERRLAQCRYVRGQLRLDRGPLSEEEATAELRRWWAEQAEAAG